MPCSTIKERMVIRLGYSSHPAIVTIIPNKCTCLLQQRGWSLLSRIKISAVLKWEYFAKNECEYERLHEYGGRWMTLLRREK